MNFFHFLKNLSSLFCAIMPIISIYVINKESLTEKMNFFTFFKKSPLPRPPRIQTDKIQTPSLCCIALTAMQPPLLLRDRPVVTSRGRAKQTFFSHTTMNASTTNLRHVTPFPLAISHECPLRRRKRPSFVLCTHQPRMPPRRRKTPFPSRRAICRDEVHLYVVWPSTSKR